MNTSLLTLFIMKYLRIVQYYCNCQTNNYSCQNIDYVYSGHTLFWLVVYVFPRIKYRNTYVKGSFRVKSPNGLNPTDSDFNEIWYTCYLGTHSTKSKIWGQSDQWYGRYGPPNFDNFGKNGRGCQPLIPHISGTSDPIFIKLVLMDRQFDKDSKYVILVQIGEYLGVLTLWPLLWPWNWPCGSRDF